MPAASNSTQPDWDVSVLHRRTNKKAKIGVAWTNPDGRISIVLDLCVVLPGGDPDLLIALFPRKESYDTRSGANLPPRGSSKGSDQDQNSCPPRDGDWASQLGND